MASLVKLVEMEGRQSAIGLLIIDSSSTLQSFSSRLAAARTSKCAGSLCSVCTKIGGDRIKGRTGMCDLLLPALDNEQYHRVVYAGLTHAFRISYFYSS